MRARVHTLSSADDYPCIPGQANKLARQRAQPPLKQTFRPHGNLSAAWQPFGRQIRPGARASARQTRRTTASLPQPAYLWHCNNENMSTDYGPEHIQLAPQQDDCTYTEKTANGKYPC